VLLPPSPLSAVPITDGILVVNGAPSHVARPYLLIKTARETPRGIGVPRRPRTA
jgi:hypothetical protein